MIGSKYFQFYNTIDTDELTVVDCLNRFTRYICEAYSNIDYGFFAVLQNGSYQFNDPLASFFNETVTIRLMTQDVHKEMYDLKTFIMDGDDLMDDMPYVTHHAFKKLIEAIVIPDIHKRHHIKMRIFHDDLLIGELIFITSVDFNLEAEFLEELKFIRNNLEIFIDPIIGHKIIDINNQLFDAASSILNSKHFQTSDTDSFMSKLLEIAIELSGEADYGSSFLYENGYWNFSDAIGHDFEQLSKISLPQDTFINNQTFWENRKEVAPNIFLLYDILNTDTKAERSLNVGLQENINAASKPIKETIQLHIYMGDLLKGVISLDIKESSNKSFTEHTVLMLKRLNFIGQILFTYSTMVSKSSSFEELTLIISKLLITNQESDRHFLKDFLALLVDSIYESSYASAYIRDNNGIRFLDSIGHDVDAINAIGLASEHFVSVDIIEENNIFKNTQYFNGSQINVALMNELLRYAQTNMPESVYKEFYKASKPIKDGMISQIHLEKDVYMYITCDIEEGSEYNFSKDSIHLFGLLSNLGFSFISNQYYINTYKKLNEALEEKVSKRTKELKETNKKLQSIVNTDSLTGLLNHKSIINKLKELINDGQALSIFLFDIDYFKKVNDTFGHQVGDDVLHQLSEFLHQEEQIIAGRYGGEEFLVILPDMDLPEAITYCQNFLSIVRNFTFIPHHPITVSGGVVTHQSCDAVDMIKSADTLLYEAKNSGRDRIKYDYC